jgi:catechol 2,3-dioxygenase-like lactoylglutathione lyase family enzyme
MRIASSVTIRRVPIDGLTAYPHVADVQRSIEFYRHLGLELRNSHEAGGKLVWAFVACPSDNPNDAGARLMLALADGPLDAEGQGVLFYCWTPDVHRLHDQLAADGVEVGDVVHPFYMQAGEFRAVDPDGYILLVGQLDDAHRGREPGH